MATKVFVDGQDGTTGLQINQVLAQRPDVQMLRIDPELRKDPAQRARLLNEADIAFLCLPDAAARESAALVTNPDTCVIDASTAHRVSSGWAYGIPELLPWQRDTLRRAKRIANPGCHASAFVLAVRPLVDAGMLPKDLALSATSITGYSGGGKKMIAQYEAGGPELASPRPYALTLGHKHIPEMVAHTGIAKRPVFMPIVASFYKGLAVTIPLQLADLGPGATASALHDALERRYEGERFVRVMPFCDPDTLEEGFFDVQACNDTNRADIFVFAGDGQALLICRLDNLGKGASGAAVQSMNVHLDIDEATGL
ncbi:MAG: N-acetyl-gamma-glutamyl-phosphate reductase [Quisquiliibacterium sp.]